MTSLILGHLMNGVMDCIPVLGLGGLGNLQFAGTCSVLSFHTFLKIGLGIPNNLTQQFCKAGGMISLLKSVTLECLGNLGVALSVSLTAHGQIHTHLTAFTGECSEVGMYLAMSRQADREGYPEVAEAFKRYAFEEADHAARFAELLGEVVWDTKTNLEKRMKAEHGACAGKLEIAKTAKAQNWDAIHDTVHEMAKDEARHGKGFEALYKRYFGK